MYKELRQTQVEKKLGHFETELENIEIANIKQMFTVKLLASSAGVCNCVVMLCILYCCIPIHILFNISQSKGNHIMKFGQLIEYNKRNIFL